jgi:CheY-like chemotaxis protein
VDEPKQSDECEERAVEPFVVQPEALVPEGEGQASGAVDEDEAVGAEEIDAPVGAGLVPEISSERVSEPSVAESPSADSISSVADSSVPEAGGSPGAQAGGGAMEVASGHESLACPQAPSGPEVGGQPLEISGSADTGLPSRRVLLADNDPNVAAILELFLKRSGAEVVSVPHGRAALEALAGDRFGLLVCDLDMPVMSGEELLELVGSDPETPPVFVISGYVDEVTSSRLRSHRAVVDVLRKPFDLRAFATRVADLLDGRGEAPPDAGVGLFGDA